MLVTSLTFLVTFFWKIQALSKNVPYAWLSPKSSRSLIPAREGICSPLGSGLWRFPFLLFVGFYFHFLFLSFSQSFNAILHNRGEHLAPRKHPIK